MPSCAESGVYMFADDTKLNSCINSETDNIIVQNDMDSMFEWSEKWLLRFHPHKCKVLPISTKSNSGQARKYKMSTSDGSKTLRETV